MDQSKDRQSAADYPAALRRYEHPLERWVGRDWVRYILRKITAERPGTARPYLYGALASYGDPRVNLHDRLAYWPIHKIIDRLRGSASRQQLRARLGGHPPTLRGIIATARSIAEFGLTIPQRWLHPLFVVWNFTNRCNLKCRHCYQSSTFQLAHQELTLSEKLSVIDQLGSQYVAMVSFAGGEPTLSADLEPCLARCSEYGMHTSLATHGGLLSRERCRRLARLGLRYVEISLDSIDPEKHDRFRGIAGAWQRGVEGIKNVVATEGLRAGLAMCITKENLHEVERMLHFAYNMGVSCFAHFNFIPVGRGADMIEQDISPRQREELLELLREWMNSRRLGVISTAPQLARLCMMHPDEDSGDVTPCVYMPHHVMGNIRAKSFTEIFQQSRWWDLFCDRNEREGTCAVCAYRNYCGGCRARAAAYLNRLDHSDPGCINNLQQWEKLTQQHAAAITTIHTNGSSHSFLHHVRSSSI